MLKTGGKAGKGRAPPAKVFHKGPSGIGERKLFPKKIFEKRRKAPAVRRGAAGAGGDAAWAAYFMYLRKLRLVFQ